MQGMREDKEEGELMCSSPPPKKKKKDEEEEKVNYGCAVR